MKSSPHPQSTHPSATPVWLVSGAGASLVIALYLAGSGSFLRLAIPAVAFAVGLALYFRRPVGYLQFTLWAWFLSPMVRRLVDYRCGFKDQNLVLLAPFLVSAISGLTLLRERRNTPGSRLIPFYLCMAAILYGFCVGMIRWKLAVPDAVSPSEVIYGLFNWLAPLLLGVHLLLRWEMYEEHKNAIQTTFLWAVLLTGAYALYQYFAPPVWDTFWLEHMTSDVGAESFGRPEPFGIRVWSTMNAPGTFATVLVAGLLLLFSARSRIKGLAAGAGYSALLLSSVRTAWLSWVLALAFLARGAQGRQIRSLLISLALLPVLLSPLLLSPQVAIAAHDRLESLSHLENDTSFGERSRMYSALLSQSASNPFGIGLSNRQQIDGYILDSGLIQMLFALGWPGLLLFIMGLCLALAGQGERNSNLTEFNLVAKAVQFSLLFALSSGLIFTSVGGVLFWMFSVMRRPALPASSISYLDRRHIRLAATTEEHACAP
jgi:hypothetical protein